MMLPTDVSKGTYTYCNVDEILEHRHYTSMHMCLYSYAKVVKIDCVITYTYMYLIFDNDIDNDTIMGIKNVVNFAVSQNTWLQCLHRKKCWAFSHFRAITTWSSNSEHSLQKKLSLISRQCRNGTNQPLEHRYTDRDRTCI